MENTYYYNYFYNSMNYCQAYGKLRYSSRQLSLISLVFSFTRNCCDMDFPQYYELNMEICGCTAEFPKIWFAKRVYTENNFTMADSWRK